MENLIQYGPYSPQEVERATLWLQQRKIAFEIIRNDQEAKEALMNDGQNVVNLADLRTGIYLAQVFYINLKNPTESDQKNFEGHFCAKPEVFHEKQKPEENDDQKLASDSRANHLKKRSWATILSALLIAQIVIAFYFIFTKGL
jgi:hypothetical protein